MVRSLVRVRHRRLSICQHDQPHSPQAALANLPSKHLGSVVFIASLATFLLYEAVASYPVLA